LIQYELSGNVSEEIARWRKVNSYLEELVARKDQPISVEKADTNSYIFNVKSEDDEITFDIVTKLFYKECLDCDIDDIGIKIDDYIISELQNEIYEKKFS